jgi:ribose 1,5-bisphosphokinase PhnN
MHPDALKQLKSSLLAVVDAAEQKGRVDEVLRIFKNVRSAGDLRKLDDLAFFTAFLEGVMELQPRLRDAFRGMTLDVIGHVPEGSDVIHVVYRGTVAQGDTKVSKMSVMSLKANGKDWGMLLTGDLEGVAASLKRQFGARD